MASMAPEGKQKYIDLQHVNTGFEPRGGKHWHQKKNKFFKEIKRISHVIPLGILIL